MDYIPEVGPIYYLNNIAKTRIVVNQGGTSSGKTWSLLQLLLVTAIENRVSISICAITLPHLKKGAMRDFINILMEAGLYEESAHNKTENIFTINDSYIEFFALDNPKKARGPRRDILYINEANLIPKETYTQLALRTKKRIYLDYNPADENHWIYEDILTLSKKEVTFIQSTYKDNTFLDPEIVKDIERLQTTDESMWKIYGLGQRAQLKGMIYPQWDLIDHLPDPSGYDVFYGLDFGYNVPSALVRCYITKERLLFIEEVIYQKQMDPEDIIEFLDASVSKSHPIYADAADPQKISKIRRAGYNCQPADKSVKDGIASVRKCKVHVTKASINIIKERNGYKYQEHANGQMLEEPVKFMDHAMDALRYAVHTRLLKPSGQYCVS